MLQQPGGRELKRIVARLLTAKDGPIRLDPVLHIPGRRLVNPLFGLFCDPDEVVRWRAVTAMGIVVARLAEESLESARVVMRRCMWNLNEESGGIGWGCAEAMGETLARSPALACEHGCILLAYLDPKCNFIDHPALQEGVLWGVGRLTQGRPEFAPAAANLLAPFLADPAPALRGLAAWAAGATADDRLTRALARVSGDEAPFPLYEDERLLRTTVGAVARRALARRKPA
jgi:hypothetical protein